jgi:hypothetical protein
MRGQNPGVTLQTTALVHEAYLRLIDARRMSWLLFSTSPLRSYQVGLDGQFYGVQAETPRPSPVVTHINLILNWFEELKAKVRPWR